MRIDSHQHFWRYHPTGYPWIPPQSALARDWLPADLEPLLSRHRIDASIAVQARQSLAETHWLLGLADAQPRIHGVVGWVDLRADDLESQLEVLASHPRLLGVRHVAQSEPDDQFLARPDIIRGVRTLHGHGLTYDILIFARQLPAALKLVEACPDQTFVVDHIAKPDIAARHREPWSSLMGRLAEYPNVFCKVSGMITEADPQHWKPADLEPYLQRVLDCFGPNRLLYGSDWPVCLLAGSYDQVHDLAATFFGSLSDSEQAAVFGGNALKAYPQRV
jgi:L-fuconolactonase